MILNTFPNIYFYDGYGILEPSNGTKQCIIVFTSPISWSKIVCLPKINRNLIYPLIEHEVKKFYPGNHDDLRISYSPINYWLPRMLTKNIDNNWYLISVWHKQKEVHVAEIFDGYEIKITSVYEILFDVFRFRTLQHNIPIPAIFSIVACNKVYAINYIDDSFDGPFILNGFPETDDLFVVRDLNRSVPWKSVMDLRIEKRRTNKNRFFGLGVAVILLLSFSFLMISYIIVDAKIKHAETNILNKIGAIQNHILELEKTQNEHENLRKQLDYAADNILPDINILLLELSYILNQGDGLLYLRWDAENRHLTLRVRAQDALISSDNLKRSRLFENINFGMIQGQEGSMIQIFTVEATLHN